MNATDGPVMLIRRGAAIEVILPDDSRLMSDLNKAVPSHLKVRRSKAVACRVWYVEAKAFDTVASVCKVDGYRVEAFSEPTSKPSQNKLSDYATLGLAEGVPWPMVEAAYRVMSKLYHPDVAGSASTEKMQQINLAYDRLGKANGR